MGVAVGVVSRNPAHGVVLPSEARELCELTEEYARETRDSWGSWSGGGGGAPGVQMSSRKAEGETSPPKLDEGDLERMGGKY